ncbi:TetR/AcrR family transcriptional regulator [Clostridium estertheticum]|uniref:TetR/AcrR family transcriptional regulator n=1 Tax=Clostridium estertheticum TaxID=238834 RepID=UPI001C0B3C6F|nr:TetR/AcrR family transcriptional regulator [Clostridium estertheticum]MBU3174618.1 TetR/AcrR family transcriptional regulator [Clostridium estertheticum]
MTIEKKKDRRTLYTQKAIKETLLSELSKKPFSKITVTELCKIAEINRGTFYLHYIDIYHVLDDIITDALSDTHYVLNSALCLNQEQCSYPLCEKMRHKGIYQPLFFDAITSTRLIDKIIESTKVDFIKKLMEQSSLTFEEAEAILRFQINGCHTLIKMMIKNQSTDWEKIKSVIDQFITSGIKCFLN